MDLGGAVEVLVMAGVALAGGAVGGSLGVRRSLARLEAERALERRRDWYERAIRQLHHYAQRIEMALTLEEPGSPDELRVSAWRALQLSHLQLELLAAEAGLHGSSSATQQVRRALSEAQRVADVTDAFDAQDVRAQLPLVGALPGLLRDAASPLAAEARAHLGLAA